MDVRLVPQHKNIIPFKMDVSKPEQVNEAAERVAIENPQGLYALYNNAGKSWLHAEYQKDTVKKLVAYVRSGV